jgi:hypothetical protein
MDISLQDTLRIRTDVVFRQLDEEAVLLNLKSGTYFGLNDVGARVWQLIAEQRTLSRVLDALVEEYDAEPHVLERDLLELSRQLCAKGLVEVNAAGGVIG